MWLSSRRTILILKITLKCIVTSNSYYNIIKVAAAVYILSVMMIPRRRRRQRVVHCRYSVYASGLTMIINF